MLSVDEMLLTRQARDIDSSIINNNVCIAYNTQYTEFGLFT